MISWREGTKWIEGNFLEGGCSYYNILLYVHLCMDVNSVTSCVIKLHYVVWVLCYYAIMWLCYHDVMMSCEFVLSRTFIVNIVTRCVIKLHYVMCCPSVMMLCLEHIFHSKYCIELGYKAPWAVYLLSTGCWGICAIEHRGWCPPRGRIL